MILKRVRKYDSKPICFDLTMKGFETLMCMQQIVKRKTGQVPSVDILINAVILSLDLEKFSDSFEADFIG